MQLRINRLVKKICGLSLLFCLSAASISLASGSDAVANDTTAGHAEKGKLEPGKLILDHISDAHSWHLWGHTELPLPVIIYSKEKGLDIFSSGRFDHGHKTYNGYALDGKNIIAVNETEPVDVHHATKNEELTASLWDFSITKNTLSLMISVALLLWIFISVAKSYTLNKNKAPSGLQSLIEPVIIFIRDNVAKSIIGEKHYERYLPYLLTVFFFIWINNLLGLVPVFPGGANVTGNIAIPMILALITFTITTFSGNKHYWQHIFAMPGIPKWVLVILTPIEILGVFIKPFVLMVRLFANILAGHIVLLVFFFLIFIFGEASLTTGLITSVPALAFTVFINCLELLVGLLQAYVFTFLSALYFGMATAEGHHEEAH